MRRRGLQADILLSLAVVMATSTAVMGVVLLRTYERQVSQLRVRAAQSLLHDAQSPLSPFTQSSEGVRWWRVGPDGSVDARGAPDVEPIDVDALALARESAQRRMPLLRAGHPWQPIRFAAPIKGSASVAVAQLPAAVSPAPAVLLVAANLLVILGFGAVLLRRGLVLPLRRLAFASRAVADGALDARVPVEGAREVTEVAVAFNDMTDALARRTGALEKAVADVRESHRELVEAREGLERVERLAAVGHLAAGVAHEVGNPMGAMLAFLDLVRRDPGLGAETREFLDRTTREGERVRSILRQLLDFSRPSTGTAREIDLGALCREIASMVMAQRKFAGIRVHVELNATPAVAWADPSAVAQILLNLVLNAADAVREGGAGGEVRLRVGPAAARRRAGDEGPSVPRRCFDAVEIRVEDNGPGIGEADAERVFAPFFTTKPPGEGTGLGLSNALRGAEQQGGGLRLDPIGPSGGACFVLTLHAPRPTGTIDGVRGAGSGRQPGGEPTTGCAPGRPSSVSNSSSKPKG